MKTIIVVDSDPNTKEITKLLLGDTYNLLFSHNTKQVLSWVLKQSVSLVIFEYLIPSTNSTQFIEDIKKMDSKVKIILTTKQPEILIPISTLSLDINDFLEKPWNPFTFRPQIDRLLYCNHNDPLDRALAYIQQYIQIPTFRVADIAAAIFMSHQSLDSNFRLIMGCTPKEYII